MSLAVIGRSFRVPSRTRRTLELVRISAVRQLSARYRGSILGVLWSFANPILMTVMYTAIFGLAFASYYGGSTVRYFVSAFVGVAVVTFFSQSTAEALPTVVVNGGLLNKIALEPETFPVSSIVASTLQQIVTTFPAVLLLSVVITHDPLRIALVPVVFAGIVVLCLGVSLILAALYVFFRDLAYLWGVMAFMIWMTCPVFYPAALVPVSVRGWLTYNPVGLAIAALREVTIGRGPFSGGTIALFLLVALGILVVGHIVFRTLRDDFMDLL